MAWAAPIDGGGVVLRVLLLATAALPASCGAGAPLSSLRFENRPPIRALDDRRPIARPWPREVGPDTSSTDAVFRVPPLHALSVPGPRPAQDVNAWDDVPDSTWFENRIGRYPLKPEDVARGPSTGALRDGERWLIESAKRRGAAPGLIAQNAAGDRYILKFDPQWPETETGADVVVQRLLWAAGYNVPDNQVIAVARADLVLDPDATREDELGREHPFTARDLDGMLAHVEPRADGRYRALASKFLDGEPLGGFAPLGVRPDDPNDRIAHQHRRSVRAQRVFFAWLGHTDVKQANSLDMWIEREEGSSRGYVVHYLLDFGKALGVWGRSGVREADGYAAEFEYGLALRSLLSFGLWRRPWEGVRAPELRGVGRYEARHFDPAFYSPANPYAPFLYADRFDAFWAARIIARFTRAHIAAAVDAARYSDPRAREYLIATIVARQRKTLRHWFGVVAPLDEFAGGGGGGTVQVCAVDLALRHGLARWSRTRYRARAYDYGGRELGPAQDIMASPDGSLCASALPLAAGRRDAYTLIALEPFRSGKPMPPVIVHVARARGGGGPRIIGVERR